MQNKKYSYLKKSLLYDAIGMATMFIPVIGTVIDLLWAPYAAKKMTDMYSGNKGKIAALIVFFEELIPGLDFVPTFTLMWLYTFVFNQERGTLIPIEVNKND
jgi:hypothetical protein